MATVDPSADPTPPGELDERGERVGIWRCMSIRSDVTGLRPSETPYLHPDRAQPLAGRIIGREDAERVASTFELLADPTRARILHALSLTEELCVHDLAHLLGMTQSALSHQLRLLRAHRALHRRKVGRVVYYRLADEHVRHVFADGLRHAIEPHPESLT
jgi:ArsR family transcriptional regulator